MSDTPDTTLPQVPAPPAGAPQQPSKNKPEDEPYDAIFVISGIAKRDAMERMAKRLATAIDRATSPKWRYTTEVRYVKLGGDTGENVKVSSILRQDLSKQNEENVENQASRILDFYEVNYHEPLLDKFGQQTVIGKSFTLLVMFLTNFARFSSRLWPFGWKTKRWYDRLQSFYLLFLFLVLAVYMAMLLVGVGEVILEFFRGVVGQNGGPGQGTQAATATARATMTIVSTVTGPSSTVTGSVTGTPSVQGPVALATGILGTLWSWLAGGVSAVVNFIGSSAQEAVVLLTAAGVLSKDQVVKFINTTAAGTVQLTNYINLGQQRDAIRGQFEQLVQDVSEGGTKYRRYHIIAYSFGTIVAIDTVFPFNGRPSQAMRRVHTLVTIGSPFDFIRTYWPNYFRGRVYIQGLPARWLNIYSPADIMGSNFRDDDNDAAAEVSVNQPERNRKARSSDARLSDTEPAAAPGDLARPAPPENRVYHEGLYGERPTLIGWLSLRGLRIHGMYWNDEDKNESNCFAIVAEEMCPDLGLDCEDTGP